MNLYLHIPGKRVEDIESDGQPRYGDSFVDKDGRWVVVRVEWQRVKIRERKGRDLVRCVDLACHVYLMEAVA